MRDSSENLSNFNVFEDFSVCLFSIGHLGQKNSITGVSSARTCGACDRKYTVNVPGDGPQTKLEERIDNHNDGDQTDS